MDDVLRILEGRSEMARVATRRKGEAMVTADPRSLKKQALLNLVANAIEATPAGGEVEVHLERDGEMVRLKVMDTGRGMAAEELARVGSPFFTTRATGTGFGVSLARGVFVEHGGSLEYERTPGRGTVATATLPISPAETGPDESRAAGR